MTTLDGDPILARPVAEHTAEQAAAALTRSFKGYIVPIKMTPQSFERRFRGENLDPFASRVYYQGEAVAGIVLVARRGWTSRIAAMGVVPDLRGQGLGRRLLTEAVEEARSRGDRAVLLEVIEQNTPAVRLYTSFGFRPLHRLFGYRKETGVAVESTDVLEEIDPLDFARRAAREGERNLPWMLSAETLASATSPLKAFHLDRRAYALTGDLSADTVPLVALVVPRSRRRQGYGSRIVRALDAAFPGKTWMVSAIVPETIAPDFFPKLGWERTKINQFEMRLDLSTAGKRTRAAAKRAQ